MIFRKKVIIFLFFSIFFVLFSCISLWRFNTGQVFYYDFGHFVRILWLISHFMSPIIQHKVLGEISFLGDHFSPSVYLLSPLFWITGKTQILLIEQALATVAAGFLLYLIAKKEKLSMVISLIVAFAFLMFAGVENPLVSDWHTESTAIVFLLLFIYEFFYRKKRIYAIIFGLIFIGFKDNNALSLFFILIPYFMELKSRRKVIGTLMIFSLLYFLIIGFVLTPYISGKPYLYSPVLPQKPLEFITNFFNLPVKRKLLFDSMASFGFLPIVSGFFILPIIGELSMRLVPTYIHSQSFTLGMHYNVYLGAFLAIASIKTLSSIKQPRDCPIQIQNVVSVLLIIISLFVAKKITNPPVILISNSIFWNQWDVRAEVFKEIAYVPVSGSVMSQNNILPHLLGRRDKVFLLSLEYRKYNPDLIIFDLSPGQNINNYYSGEINSVDQVNQLRERLLIDKIYQRLPTSYTNLYIFKKR